MTVRIKDFTLEVDVQASDTVTRNVQVEYVYADKRAVFVGLRGEEVQNLVAHIADGHVLVAKPVSAQPRATKLEATALAVVAKARETVDEKRGPAASPKCWSCGANLTVVGDCIACGKTKAYQVVPVEAAQAASEMKMEVQPAQIVASAELKPAPEPVVEKPKKAEKAAPASKPANIAIACDGCGATVQFDGLVEHKKTCKPPAKKEPAPAPEKPAEGNGVPEALVKAKLLRDVLFYLHEHGCSTANDVVAECTRVQPHVPLLRAMNENMEKRVRDTFSLLALDGE